MPALLILAVISWLFGSGKSRSKSERVPFETVQIRRRKPWGGLSISLLLHAALIPILIISSDIAADSDDQKLASWLADRSLIIKLPEHLYLAQANGDSPATPAVPRRKMRISLNRAEADNNSQRNLQPILQRSGANRSLMAKGPTRIKRVPRQFELPDLARLELRTQTVLQAEIPPNLAPKFEKSLPQLLFWAAEERTITPRPQPVTPGNREMIAQRPDLDAPPKLAPPNREVATSDLRIASALTTIQPALPRAPGTTMPIRVFQPANNAAVGPRAIDSFQGDPVHVLAISPTPAPLTDTMQKLFVPAGNQVARLPGDASQAPDGQAGETGQGNGAGTVVKPEAGAVLARNSGAGGGSGDPTGTGAATPSSASAAAGDTPTVVHALPGDGRLLGLLTPPALPDMAIRMVHPANGVFDVIVVQSSVNEAFPETSNSLSGRPVYTVYLQVGSAKEWILQYCIPSAMEGPIQAGNFVRLGNPAPLTAPYPIVTARPPLEWRKDEGYVLVHGFLDASGRFRDMTIIPNADHPSGDAVLQYLAHWEFRPALQDGRPVMVEVVLAIPPDKA